MSPETTTPRIGVLRDEDISAYHACDALSKSKLSDFQRSPLLYFRRYVEKSLPREPMSKAFLIGRGAHTLTLEGEEEYTRRFAVLPYDAPDRPTKAMLEAKAPSPASIARLQWWASFDAANSGKTILRPEEDAVHRQIAKSVHAQPIAALLLSEGEPEVTFRVQTSRYAIQCRPDWVNFGASGALSKALHALGVELAEGEPYCVDLKTVESLSELEYHNFAKNFVAFGYHQQGPLYRSVIRDAVDIGIDKFFFVPVEKSELFQTAVFLPDETANAQGWEEIVASLSRLNTCHDTGVWPGVPTRLQTVSLPDWYLRKAGAL